MHGRAAQGRALHCIALHCIALHCTANDHLIWDWSGLTANNSYITNHHLRNPHTPHPVNSKFQRFNTKQRGVNSQLPSPTSHRP